MKFVIDPAEIQKLSPMPTSVAKLLRLTANPEVNIYEICRVIEFDEALTSNVLRWANSAWSGTHGRIKTVKESVVRLGMAQLLKLAVGYRLAETMKNQSVPYPGVEKKLWQHSVTSALVVEQLSEFTTLEIPPITFTAALIHDIGKLLLFRHLRPETMKELWQFIEAGENAVEAESGVLGTNHAIVGGEIAWFWKFPDELIAAIEKHHDPNPPQEVVIHAVQVANMVANVNGNIKTQRLPTNQESYLALGLNLDQLDQLHTTVMDKLEETLTLWEA